MTFLVLMLWRHELLLHWCRLQGAPCNLHQCRLLLHQWKSSDFRWSARGIACLIVLYGTARLLAWTLNGWVTTSASKGTSKIRKKTTEAFGCWPLAHTKLLNENPSIIPKTVSFIQNNSASFSWDACQISKMINAEYFLKFWLIPNY